MPWMYDEQNIWTEVVFPYFGSQNAVAAALGVDGPQVMRWRKRGELTAEQAVRLEELTRGELCRTELRPDLWPRKRWRRIRYPRADEL